MERETVAIDKPDSHVTYAKLQKSDILTLRSIVTEFGRESGLASQFSLPVDFSHFASTVKAMMDVGVGTGILAWQDGRVVGMMILSVTDHLFTGARTVSELAWYVRKSHRNTNVGVRLFRMAERHAEEIEAELFTMIFLENSMPERLERFYQKRGFEKVETNYVKRLWKST